MFYFYIYCKHKSQKIVVNQFISKINKNVLYYTFVYYKASFYCEINFSQK